MKKVYLNFKKEFLAIGVSIVSLSGIAQTINYSDTLVYTGSMQSYTIPNCASNIVITTYGAQGAGGSTVNPSINSGGQAGLGNAVTGEWTNLNPGQTIYVNIGGSATGATGGYNGGGNGISSNGENPSGGGGGATDVRFPTDAPTDRIQVAGGGGGGGNAAYHWNGASFTEGNGGNGGGNQTLNGNSLDATDGEASIGDAGNTYFGGFGGTTAGPGAGGVGCGGFLGQNGGANSGAVGGAGGLGSSLNLPNFSAHGGAGGGGYVGGNGGGGGSAGTTGCSGNNIGAAGGGSAGTNYFNGEPTNFENGVREGDGLVVIQYSITAEEASLSASTTPCVSQEIDLDFSPAGGTFTVLQGNSADVDANGVFTPSATGTYEIVYSATDLCTNETIADTLTLIITCDLASLNEETANNLVVFPNPALNTLFIQSDRVLGQVNIIDIRGQLVYSIETTTNLVEVDVRNLESGCYFIHTNESVKRVIVK